MVLFSYVLLLANSTEGAETYNKVYSGIPTMDKANLRICLTVFILAIAVVFWLIL